VHPFHQRLGRGDELRAAVGGSRRTLRFGHLDLPYPSRDFTPPPSTRLASSTFIGDAPITM
jgi:hypothetical protein